MFGMLFGRALARWLDTAADEPAPSRRREPPRPPARLEVTPQRPVRANALRAPQAANGELVCPRLGRTAMGCLFEAYLAGYDRTALEGAGEQALDEVERLDRQLSHYRDDSDITRLNAHASTHWVRLEPGIYSLLTRCRAMHDASNGAFDIAVQPLLVAWGFHSGVHRVPPDDEVDDLLHRCSTRLIAWDDDESLVHYTAPGMAVSLGAIGKGHAVDRAVDVLRSYAVESGVVHGGSSTIYALGQPPDSDAWEFAVRDPRDGATPVATLRLRDQAVSTSAATEQRFGAAGTIHGHILDPRTGRPASGVLSTTVVSASAEMSDALATALQVAGADGLAWVPELAPEARVIMVIETEGGVVALDAEGGHEPLRAALPGRRAP